MGSVGNFKAHTICGLGWVSFSPYRSYEAKRAMCDSVAVQEAAEHHKAVGESTRRWGDQPAIDANISDPRQRRPIK